MGLLEYLDIFVLFDKLIQKRADYILEILRFGVFNMNCLKWMTVYYTCNLFVKNGIYTWNYLVTIIVYINLELISNYNCIYILGTN